MSYDREEKRDQQAKFYTFCQNNSGGSFVVDEDLSHFVIIEAHTSEEANYKAEDLGIYFNGCEDGRDCTCCGDRWYPVNKTDAEDKPMVYDTPAHKWKDLFISVPVRIHYLNGRIKKCGSLETPQQHFNRSTKGLAKLKKMLDDKKKSK